MEWARFIKQSILGSAKQKMTVAMHCITHDMRAMQLIAKRIQPNINLRARMHWQRLKKNLWRFVKSRNKHLVNLVASAMIQYNITPRLPTELILHILAKLNADELTALLISCAPIMKQCRRQVINNTIYRSTTV
ncbi:MAG: hypothetical protein EOO38_14370 [Cytophagaceae bacterium]|nr:MAG: hypothetical protein EOO38_14370 [Cytophagaceae bacterium]